MVRWPLGTFSSSRITLAKILPAANTLPIVVLKADALILNFNNCPFVPYFGKNLRFPEYGESNDFAEASGVAVLSVAIC